MSKNESLIQYGTSFQSKIIASLLLNNKFIKTVYDILETSYFDADSNKFIIKQIKEYFDHYKIPPTMEALKVIIDDLFRKMIDRNLDSININMAIKGSVLQCSRHSVEPADLYEN